MCVGRRQRRIGHRKCCSDVVHGRRVAPRTAGVSVPKQQPVDNRPQGNPAPGLTVHEKQDSLAYNGSVAEQTTVDCSSCLDQRLRMTVGHIEQSWSCLLYTSDAADE